MNLSSGRVEVLLTGFEPFADHPRNPSADVVRRLGRDPELRARGVRTAILPVGREESASALDRLLARRRPRVLVLTGLAARRELVTVERIAVNWWRAPGSRGLGRRIRPGGPDGIFSTIPPARVLAALRRGGAPAEVSESAGTYACNLVLHRALEGAASGEFPGLVATFVHLPPTPESLPAGGALRTLPLGVLVAGLRELVVDLSAG